MADTKQIEKELARIQGEIDKFKQLIAEKEWKDGDEFFYVPADGIVESGWWFSSNRWQNRLKDQGTVFKTREEAELHSKRIRSLKRTCMPTEGQSGWVVAHDGGVVQWDFSWNEAGGVAYYFSGRWHPTREGAEAWQAEFGECFRRVE